MNRIAITLAVALSTLGSAAFAASSGPVGEASYEVPTVLSTSTLSRDEVRADTLRALRDGSVIVGEAQAPVTTAVMSGVSRTQVAAEAREAVRLGLTAVGERSIEPTASQLRAIQVAGERAVAQQLAMVAR